MTRPLSDAAQGLVLTSPIRVLAPQWGEIEPEGLYWLTERRKSGYLKPCSLVQLIG